MSSMLDMHENGDVQYQEFPPKASIGRVLCLRGNDTHDGSWNSYALAWPHALPRNATLFQGLTFVSYNHYNYDNIWHGLSAIVPFIAWHIKNSCSGSDSPARWVLYHWGEVRTRMGSWISLSSLMEATFAEPVNIESFESVAENSPVCFERSVVMRHNEGGMSREKKLEVYDLLRLEMQSESVVLQQNGGHPRVFPVIGMTMFLRTGARPFNNDTTVIGIFNRACRKVEGCRLVVVYANNRTFCQQMMCWL